MDESDIKFIECIIKQFETNPKEVDLQKTEDVPPSFLMRMKLHRPIKDFNDYSEMIISFNIVIEINDLRASVKVMETGFNGRSWQALSDPIEVVLLDEYIETRQTDLYHKLELLYEYIETRQDEMRETKRNEIINEFLEGNLTTENQVQRCLEEAEKSKVKGGIDIAIPEPIIMNFGDVD